MNKKFKNKLVYVGRKEPHFYTFTTQEYSQYAQLYSIIAQVTKLMLRKVQVNPNQIIQEYTNQHLKGQHVLLKSYNNFSKSPLNRLCFITNFTKVFDLQQQKFQKNGFDYLQLLRLVCSDFPREIIVNTLRLCNKDWISQQDQIFQKNYNSTQFINAFFMYFMYGDFLKFLEKSQKMKLKQLLHFVKESYSKFNKQLQKPSFRILADVILKLSKYDSKDIIFVTEQNIENYLTNQNITYNTFVHQLYQSPLNCNEMEERLEIVDNVSGRIAQIIRIASEKIDVNSQQKIGKKSKKK